MPGETVAVVGPSGSSKSTIVSQLERFCDPMGGIVTVDGADKRMLNVKWSHSQIGLAGQESSLFATFVMESIPYGCTSATDKQTQRIAIARAIIKKSPILLLGEATSVLDTESERIVQASLDRQQANTDLTTILVVHHLSTIRYANRIAVHSGDAIVEIGLREELMKLDNGHDRILAQAQDRVSSEEDEKSLLKK
ncbi:unnamed protein product [Hyaloperonospora brassicae]|uniref:ABC transporter domain-containing protein n=1 Tax=Hyaloperonospora brassicae TaxID=162125 RepID=A0AAV0U9I3_HYABA|nr:unnamed protein product [Hyaloperonospora brassicae]